jgi:hypothetical protein
VRGETATLLGPLERTNLNHWTVHVSITTAMLMPETGICGREITSTIYIAYYPVIFLRHSPVSDIYITVITLTYVVK